MFKLLTIFLCLSAGLYADSEYEIILLAPKGDVIIHYDSHQSSGLNEAGYAWFSHGASSYIYHNSFGLKKIPNVFNENHRSSVEAVNNQGIALGLLTTKSNQLSEPDSHQVFVYDTKNDEFYDLLNEDATVETLIDGNLSDLTLTDGNDIVYTRKNDSNTYYYNLNNKSAKTLTHSHSNFKAANANGQVIGYGDNWYWDIDLEAYQFLSSNNSWYWDIDSDVSYFEDL